MNKLNKRVFRYGNKAMKFVIIIVIVICNNMIHFSVVIKHLTNKLIKKCLPNQEYCKKGTRKKTLFYFMLSL